MSLVAITWEQLQDDAIGTVYVDERHDLGRGRVFRLLVIRGGSSACAYLGVPLDSALAREMRAEASPDEKLNVHGGVTFNGSGRQHFDEDMQPWYWWGWDYGHAGDRLAFPPEARAALEEAEEATDRQLPTFMKSFQPLPGFFDYWNPFESYSILRSGRAWSPFEVWADAQEPVAQFAKLIEWAERREVFRRIVKSTKMRDCRPLMRRVLTAKIEPLPARPPRLSLRKSLADFRAYRQQRERKRREREIRALKRMVRGR